MSIAIRHRFSSVVADGATTGWVKPSNWNDNHDISLAASSLLGRYAATPGAAQEITLNLDDLALSSSTGVLALATMGGLVPGDYLNSNITVDSKGRITAIGNGTTSGGADASSEYILGVANPIYPNMRVLTDSDTVDVDLGTSGQAKFNVITSGLDASDLLALLLTVDGASSGLDADLLDGNSSAFYATASSVTDHLADTSDAHDASAISVLDSGNNYTATDVEAALAEVYDALEAHIADATAAHAATAISFAPDGTISAITVQAAIVEVRDEAQPLDSDLTAIAGLSPSNDDIIQRKAGAWTNRTMTQLASDLDSFFLTPTEGNAAYQPLDSDLTSWAGVTRASGFDTFVATPSSANLRALLTDETGTGAAYFAGGDAGTPSALVLTNATGLPTAGLVDDAVTFAKFQNITSDRLLGRDTASSGNTEEISLNATLEFTGSASIQRAALTGAVAASAGSNSTTMTGGLVFIIDGGGSTITTGIKGDVRVPFACTVTGWTLLAGQSGAIVVDVWRDTLANFPPTDADSLTNGSEPEITASGTNAEDTNLGDWTDTTLDAGDVLRFNVDSVTDIQRVTLILHITKTG